MLVCTFLTYRYNALYLRSNCKSIDYMSVSYTHLTLPTICSV